MANICMTTLHIMGDKNNIKKMYNDFKKFLNPSKGTWVGEHIKLFGYDASKIQREDFNLRATIYDYDVSEECINLDLECAWAPCYDYMSFLQDKYDVDVYYVADEPGCDLYLTNQIDSINPYVISIDKEGFDCCFNEFKTEEGRTEYIKENGLTEDDYTLGEYSEYHDWYRHIDYDKLPTINENDNENQN